jgi:hypothetical protein
MSLETILVPLAILLRMIGAEKGETSARQGRRTIEVSVDLDGMQKPSQSHICINVRGEGAMTSIPVSVTRS